LYANVFVNAITQASDTPQNNEDYSMRNKRIKVRSGSAQIAITILLGFLSLAASAYVVVSYYRSVTSHIGRIAESAFTATAGEVENWVQSKETTIELVGKTLGEFSGSPESINTFLKSVKADDEDFIDIFFGTANGPHQNGFAVYATDWVMPGGFEWTERLWFRQAVEKGSLVVTKPYKDLQTGKTIITISKPVVVNGVLYGVVAADISTASVKKIIDNVYTAKDSTIRLIDGEGNVINVNDEKGVREGNVFKIPALVPYKKIILNNDFFLKMNATANIYYAKIGFPDLGWIMLADGPLSSFEDVRGTVIQFASILLFLAALFLFILARSWRANRQLAFATGEIERANQDLERVVDERTASLKNILDSAEEGFFTFGETLIIDPSVSKGCTDIFGKDIKGLSAPDVIFPGMTQIIGDFRQGFELYFTGKSKAAIIFDLTEKQTTIREKTIRITYKETAGQRILCILKDITLELEMEEKNRREAETQRRILRAIHNKHFFAQFLSSADNLFALLEMYADQSPDTDERDSLMRAIHTFKGDAGFFGFVDTQAIAHESETVITDSINLDTTVSYKEILIQTRKAYYKELKTISDTMGERWIDESNGVLIPTGEFQKILAYLRKKQPYDAKLVSFLDAFRKITLSELFSRLPFAAAVTAEKLGKKIKPMIVTGGTQKIVPDRFMPLAEACIHIVNNMVDHGIEYPYERESIQKPPEGKIELTITVEKSALNLEFKDDGRGINPKEIEKVARHRELIPEGRTLQTSELYALLFEDGFTTRKEVSSTSGRGVGLAAVREVVNKMGGTIEIQSKLGKGTTFEIMIPLASRSGENQ
jgi:two-component system chemotaxis sensor kinase CheA